MWGKVCHTQVHGTVTGTGDGQLNVKAHGCPHSLQSSSGAHDAGDSLSSLHLALAARLTFAEPFSGIAI